MNPYYIAWYKESYSLNAEEWLYIAYMLVMANIAFGVGLLIGLML